MHIIVVQVMALLVAITAHEFAHGWMSDRLGDPTPRQAGRVTFNPIAHLDLFGTIIFPALLILTKSPILLGWAKPVPINPKYYRNSLKGTAMVSLAGPGANLVLAFAAGLILKLRFLWPASPGEVSAPLQTFLLYMVVVNVGLAIFNLVPIPPLDGGHFLQSVLPARQALILHKMEPYGMFIIMGLLYLGVLDFFFRPLSFLLYRILL